MAKRRKDKKANQRQDRPERRAAEAPGPRPEPRGTPLRVARGLSVLILLLGGLMLVLGGAVSAGVIKEGWGFPMSAVPNWGRPWGVVLVLAAIAYVLCPLLIFSRPRGGTIAMIVLCGLNVLVGTPLITTTTEIFYNLFQETKSRPDWVDSVWGYFMILNVGILVALYRATGDAPRSAVAVTKE